MKKKSVTIYAKLVEFPELGLFAYVSLDPYCVVKSENEEDAMRNLINELLNDNAKWSYRQDYERIQINRRGQIYYVSLKDVKASYDRILDNLVWKPLNDMLNKSRIHPMVEVDDDGKE